ncbi:bactofilin family protein [Effusibacillus lacus]|uniref:Cell shape determination protein CcmA n=1 Tax=Effusibacillus lacus TaxID=1348429 RepID=A0A292YF88_9BACL|nr:polymer-forming cytoskeletal protein [Effusibacillus lacus]TCS74735.1 cytoskeletal protein CcmA (bactofilin family) [Effusibacillus lacus]GAX88547.1 hypothetical protein EFBL_0159 [Effusibacillus lacus]
MFKKEAPAANGKVDTLIGAGTTIEGMIQTNGILRVEGRIRGELMSDGDVIVGEKGEVHANVLARHVTVGGKVYGNVLASGKMHLMKTGSIQGDIEAGTIVIEEGAYIKGVCKMVDPKSDASHPVKPELKSQQEEPESKAPSPVPEPASTVTTT